MLVICLGYTRPDMNGKAELTIAADIGNIQASA